MRKEYHKYVRHQSWLPKCLRCSKSPGSSSATSSGTSGSSAVKDGRGTTLYPANSSNINSHSDGAASPHGTSVGTNVNNIISNNLNNANIRPSPTLVQVLNHHNNPSTTNHNRLHNVASQGIISTHRHKNTVGIQNTTYWILSRDCWWYYSAICSSLLET